MPTSTLTAIAAALRNHAGWCGLRETVPGGTTAAALTGWAAELEALAESRLYAEVGTVERPRIVCLCGSTRFIEQFATATWVLELQGAIVLGCTLLPMWFCGVRSHFAEATGTKEQRDWHHQRKIDLADEVLVLDIGGYIGESTRNEIAYAATLKKPVRYASQDAELLAAILPTNEGDQQQQHEALKHIKAQRDRLRAALVGLIGVDGRADLEQMEAVMRLMPAPAEDKAVTIDAIHALIAIGEGA